MEELVFATVGLGFGHLKEVSVDEVAYVALVEGRLVLVHRLLQEAGHLLAVAVYLGFDRLQPG